MEDPVSVALKARSPRIRLFLDRPCPGSSCEGCTGSKPTGVAVFSSAPVDTMGLRRPLGEVDGRC